MPQDEPQNDAPQKRRYRILLFVETILLLVTVLGFCLGHEMQRDFPVWVIGLLGLLSMWHVIAILICAFYPLGNPIVMSLEPLIDSMETRTFRRELRERSALGDEEFYARFYSDSGIYKEIPIGIRHWLILNLDPLMDRIAPHDPFYLLIPGIDLADVLKGIGRQFGIGFTKADYPLVDGTFDNLVRLVADRVLRNLYFLGQ